MSMTLAASDHRSLISPLRLCKPCRELDVLRDLVVDRMVIDTEQGTHLRISLEPSPHQELSARNGSWIRLPNGLRPFRTSGRNAMISFSEGMDDCSVWAALIAFWDLPRR